MRCVLCQKNICILLKEIEYFLPFIGALNQNSLFILFTPNTDLFKYQTLTEQQKLG